MNLSRSRMLLGLVLLTVLAYGNTTQNGFLWDDQSHIIENSHIRNHHYLGIVFRSDLFHRHAATAVPYYRPMQTVSYMADYALWGLNPFGYHLTNLALHLGCVLLLALLVEQLSASFCGREPARGLSMQTPSPAASRLAATGRNHRWMAVAVAGLFAVHPVLTNAVSYVAGRADSLALGLMLTAWLLLLRGGSLCFAAALVCYLGALCSRENAFLFPLLLLLHGLIKERSWRRGLWTALPFALLLLAFAVWRHAVVSLQGPVTHGSWALPGWVRLQIPFRALATYLGLLVWPGHLQMERQVVVGGAWLHFLTVAGVLAVAGLVVLARQNRLACFGVCWFAVTLLPVSGLFSLNATVAEHWLYVPCVGLFLAVAAIVPQQRAAAIALAAVLVALAGRTMVRNRDWQDGKRLFAQTKEAAPHSTAARVNLGLEYALAGETNRALKEWISSLQVSPGDAYVWNNLAAFYLKQGDLVRAEAVAEESLRQAPGNVGALLRLADVWEQRGNFGKARLCYTRALAQNLSVSLRLEYGQFFLRQQRPVGALEMAHEALALEPPNAEAHNLLGVALAEIGRFDEAQKAFEDARRLDRHSRNAERNLARLRAMRERRS